MKTDEIIITVGNTDVRITKEGKIQVKTKEGSAHLKQKGNYWFSTTSTSWVDVTSLDLSSNTQQFEIGIQPNEQTKIILQALRNLANEVKHQREQLSKLIALVSQMYQDGEINKDTFNKLDDFLKPYYDHPYEDEN